MASQQRKQQRRRLQKPLPAAETGYSVDPLSDLVTASELRAWRSHATTRKVFRYLTRFRGQVVEQLAEGASTEPTTDATAMRTVEFVSKAQLLKDLLTLEAKDVADFYALPMPADPEEKKK